MSQIMKIEIPYGELDKLKALDVFTWDALRARIKEVDWPEKQEAIPSWTDYQFVGIFEDVQYLSDLGIKTTVSRVRGQFAESLPVLGVPETQGLQVVNVTIPNAGLFSVRRLRVLTDECTERVQDWLNDGWRIVAVCPPNDTRRPTYIMGHMELTSEGIR